MRLHKVLHLSDNYFTEQKLDVEKAVDDYFQQEYQKISRHVDLQAVPDDLLRPHVLPFGPPPSRARELG